MTFNSKIGSLYGKLGKTIVEILVHLTDIKTLSKHYLTIFAASLREGIVIFVPNLKWENPDSTGFSAQGDQAMKRQCLDFTQVLSYQGQCSSLCLLHLVQLFVTPWIVTHHAPLSMGFSRPEYWSGLPFLPLGDLPHSGIEPLSPALAGRFFTTEPPGKPLSLIHRCLFSTHTHKKTSHQDSLIAQLVKNLPAMQETLVQFLGQEDLLEKV